MKADGAKLSKSSGDTGVRELRAAGAAPDSVLGRRHGGRGLLDRPRADGGGGRSPRSFSRR